MLKWTLNKKDKDELYYVILLAKYITLFYIIYHISHHPNQRRKLYDDIICKLYIILSFFLLNSILIRKEFESIKIIYNIISDVC